MKNPNAHPDIQAMKERIAYLEEINRLTMDALEMAASLGDFQKSINSLVHPSEILREARRRVLKLLPFRATAFFLVNESNAEFFLHDCKPEDYQGVLQEEVDRLIENGTFAWVLREKRPLIVSTRTFENRLILHRMSTASRTRGMFVGLLVGDEKDIPHVSLSLLSIVLLNTANALESFELYSMVKEINVNLEKLVEQRTEELTNRVAFENLIATLSTTFINLETDDIDAGIRHALGTIGAFIHADHGFILIRSENDPVSKEIYRWCADGRRPIKQTLEAVSFRDDVLLSRCMRNQKNVTIPSVETLTADSRRCSKLLESRDIESLILVPIVSGNSAIGVLGFAATTGRPTWCQSTGHQIKIVADMFVHALERKWGDQERRALEVQLQHTHRIKGLGTLAAGVAHELNQPLMVIRTFVQMQLRELTPGAEHYEELTMMEKNTGRMKKIIDHLRDFSRQQPSEVRPIDVNTVIDDAFLLVGEQLRRADIAVEKQLASDLPYVTGSASQLEQVFVNLITNAVDSIREKRSVREDVNSGHIKIVSRREKSGFEDAVEVLVGDNGCGIPEDIASRIFEPFFTTKDVGKGTGLGLSISYGIMKEHRGRIEIIQTVPEGSTFCIRIPVASPPPLVA